LKNPAYKFATLCFCVSLIFIGGCKTSDINKIVEQINNKPLDQKTVVAGLKEALKIGTQNAVLTSGKENGFYHNSRIKIPVPNELNKVTKALNKLGLKRFVDKFEVQMNRSAENAVKQATEIFVAAIVQMTIQDAFNILNGDDTAATQYFRDKTEVQLKVKFKPVVNNAMRQLSFYTSYEKMLKTYESIPFSQKLNLDIEVYILDKTTDGLFLLIADEEKQIRQNPAARVTDLLKRVFG